MHTNISVKIINEHRLKVIAPYNEEFVVEARLLHGTWRRNAWWFDDSAMDRLRELLLRQWNTTGEAPYDSCSLLIRNLNKSARRGTVFLFNRMIAKAFGRMSKIKMGDDIYFISGTIKPGGDLYYWETQCVDATFVIGNFPLPATELPEVQKAISEGWCEIKTGEVESWKDELKLVSSNEEVYKFV